MHGEMEGVYMEEVECVCMDEERKGACIWKVLSVIAFGEGGNLSVHMEGVECACMGVCIWKGGVCAHGERDGVCMEGSRGRVYIWNG